MAVNGIDPTTFNPNAGREEAYNNRWQKYLTNLGQTQNKINVKKARKYFDQQFEQDWNNEAASREIDFISQKAKQDQQNLISKWRQERETAELASQEQDARDYEAAGYIFDLNKGWIKPTTLQQPVRDKNGRTKEEVRALQQEMLNAGYDLGKYGVDGVWGPDTQLAYDMYIQSGKKPFKEAFPEPSANNTPEPLEQSSDWHWQKNAKKNSQGQLMWGSGWRDRYIGDNFYNYGNNRYRIAVNKDSNQSYLVDLTNGKYIQADENMWGRIDDNAMNNRLASGSGWMDITKESGLFQYKIGGIIKQILKNSNVYPYNL